MRSSMLKWLVLSATILIGLIVIVQVFWLTKVYSFEKKQFNTNVVKSLRGVFEDLEMNDDPSLSLQQLIHNPEDDYFLFQADTIPEKDSLTHYLRKEFGDFDVLTDVKLGAYSSRKKEFVYEEYIPTVASRFDVTPVSGLPVFNATYDHILLYFPHRSLYILGEMNFWIISSVALSLALIGLAISLFYFYRQKFLAEVQKDFVNNFTHEFKTPLAVIKIAGDVIGQEDIFKKPDRLKKYASIIQSQTAHLQNQVEKLLKSASADNKKLPMDKHTLNPAMLIEQALNKLQPLIEQRQAKVELKVDNYETLIRGDESHLELAVVNLLENALKYSSLPHIVVQAGREDADYFISVKDNGIGIEKKYIKNIFK
ncbi:MAG: HAMP domain-containing sensor histidine kinase, partial [Bacteroidota bacterium]|nr:HAMP domain-containing sensor histidine kinase [Bacteroidota bacterium]